MFYGQKVLPALSSFKNIEFFLKSSLKYGILVNVHLSQLPILVEKFHKHNKKCFIHADMIKGLSSDEFGAIYLIQELNVDGIISTKQKVIETAKKRGVVSIQRIFLKDSYSFERSIEIIKQAQPDCLEILPALAHDIIQVLRKKIGIPMICGGLLFDKTQIDTCIEKGAIAVSASNRDLWL